MPPSDRVIEQLLRDIPPAEAELRRAAEEEWRRRIDPHDEARIDSASQRLARQPRERWIGWLLVAMGVVSVAVIVTSMPAMLQIRGQQAPWSRSEMSPPSLDAIPSESRLLLEGDPSRSSESERWKALWESRPQDPACYIEYAAHFLDEHDSLPADFLATAERLDPGNS